MKRIAVVTLVAVLALLNIWQYALREVQQDSSAVRVIERWQRRPDPDWPVAADARKLPADFGLSRRDQKVVHEFHRVFYDSHLVTWEGSQWLGVECQQNPNDVWITQEILHEVKPDLVIETGTYKGGSAVLWSSLLEHINPEAKVVTIDIEDHSAAARQHPLFQRRVTFILGSSTAPDVVERVREMARGKKTLVILDSDHTASHVLAEMRAYKELVSPGSYMIVQDTNVNGHPVAPQHGPGPMEAVMRFLAETDEFVPDRRRERLLFTMHPHGYLRRR